MVMKSSTKKPQTKYPKAVCEGKLRIHNTEISCAVLDNGERVLSQRETLETIGRSRHSGSSRSGRGATDLPTYLRAQNLQDFIPPELRDSEKIRIVYSPMKGGRTGYGISAELLPLICEVYLEANAANALQKSQEKIADICRMLQNGFARVGITALVDEATGYQSVRATNALAKILERYLSEEIRKWTQTFPLDFYRQIYRLRGWAWEEKEGGKKPSTPWIVGRYTDDLIYKRLAPGVLNELRKRDSGVRRHQWFNTENGYPALTNHIGNVITVMRLSDDWKDFRGKMDSLFPVYWDQEGDLFYTPRKKPKK